MADLADDATAQRSPRGIWRRLNDLEAAVAFLRSSRDLVGRATVEVGKSLIIKGTLLVIGKLDVTGTVSMKSEDGEELFRLGDMEFGRGVEMKRDNGILAFVLSKVFEVSAQQTWSLRDQRGEQVVAENGLGPGLLQPFLEYPFQPVAAASGTAAPTCGPWGWERTTSSGSWTTLFAYDGKVQNPFLDLKFAAVCSDGTTAGEVQVVDLNTGVPLAGFLLPAWVGAIPAGTTVMTLLDPDPAWILLPIWGPTEHVGDQMRIGLQCRRTAGAGSITVSVPQAIGG